MCADAYSLSEFLDIHRRTLKTETHLLPFYRETRSVLQDGIIMAMIESRLNKGDVMCGCNDPERLAKENEERRAFLENGPGEFITIVTPEYHYDVRDYSEDGLCSWSVENDWIPIVNKNDDDEKRMEDSKVDNGYETLCWIPHDTTHSEFEDEMNERHDSWRHNLQYIYDRLADHRRYFSEPHKTEQDSIFKNMHTSIILSASGL